MNTLITSTHLSRLISTAIFGALTLSWGATSIAADETEAPQVVVKFGDLNLSNPPHRFLSKHRLSFRPPQVSLLAFEHKETLARLLFLHWKPTRGSVEETMVIGCRRRLVMKRIVSRCPQEVSGRDVRKVS